MKFIKVIVITGVVMALSAATVINPVFNLPEQYQSNTALCVLIMAVLALIPVGRSMVKTGSFLASVVFPLLVELAVSHFSCLRGRSKERSARNGTIASLLADVVTLPFLGPINAVFTVLFGVSTLSKLVSERDQCVA